MGASPRPLRRLIVGAVFAAAAVGTVAWCASMEPGMPMRGGWTMSMAWMRMPGQTWPSAHAAFVAMWSMTMVAMMLPSIAPILLAHRRPLRVAIAYFGVWTLAGFVVHPIGAALAAAEMGSSSLARAVPILGAVAIATAGAWQLTRTKLRALARCRDRACCALGRSPSARDAWADGLRLGVRCVRCCVAPMTVLFAAGVMSLPAMAMVSVAITAERLGPRPRVIARTFGVAALCVGVAWIVLGIRSA
jgi:predicted metal-binding membrane protein